MTEPKNTPRPFRDREPSCAHPGGERQPASACRICRDGPALREWKEQWAAWLAENPDSPEARYLEALKSGNRHVIGLPLAGRLPSIQP